MEETKGWQLTLAGLTALLCLAVGLCGVFRLREAEMRREMAMQQQREMADVIAAMADIEVNLSSCWWPRARGRACRCWGRRRCSRSSWKAVFPA